MHSVSPHLFFLIALAMFGKIRSFIQTTRSSPPAAAAQRYITRRWLNRILADFEECAVNEGTGELEVTIDQEDNRAKHIKKVHNDRC
jgi:hypothetical protein